MKERGIIMSGPMVRAIRDGRKTQTRRIVKQATDHGEIAFAVEPAKDSGWIAWFGQPDPTVRQLTKRAYSNGFACPFGVPGDRLWIRETFAQWPVASGQYRYRADGEWTDEERAAGAQWAGGFLMPRVASRIVVGVTDIRVEPLQAISEIGAIAEGIDGIEPEPREAFRELWESIHGPGSWVVNPWVWVIQFGPVAHTYFLNEQHEEHIRR